MSSRIDMQTGNTPRSPAVAEASRLDAAGDHDEAINALARATKSGDLVAMTELGKRLLVGDRAPPLPREGASFLVDATQQGAVEAPARLAVLAAAGVYMNQSWKEAFDLLVLAAERGWQDARGQLAALSPDAPLVASAASSAEAPADLWRRLCSSIDRDYWTTAPAATTLHESPLVRAYKRFAPAAVCDWLISRASGNLGPALVYDPVAGEDKRDKHRSNTAASFNLVETDLVQLLVQARMWACCGLPLYNMETMTVLHYDIGEEITNHFDFVDPKIPNYEQEIEKNGQRILTFLLYLNDDYDGGETEFPKLGVRHKGRRGEGLYFVNALANRKPDLRAMHAGRPPTRGEKWVVSQFVRDREVLRRH